MSMSWNNFAPRAGIVYRLNEKTVARGGYGLTYNAQPWARAVRGDNDYPVTIASTFVNRSSSPPTHLAQGIPLMLGPDQSSGRVPLDRSAAVYTPEIGNVDRGYVQTWNLTLERRLPARHLGGRWLRRRQGQGRLRGLDINAPTALGGGEPAVRTPTSAAHRDQLLGPAH
jgi:hypothetical protein